MLYILTLTAALITSAYWIRKLTRIRRISAGSKLADLDGGPIEYTLTGQTGPVVLYLHGSPGGYDRASFAHPEFRTLAVSRPGYLRTPIDVGHTPTEQANAIARLLDALDIDHVIVMAASGGGPTAIELATSSPERVTQMILIEPVSRALELPALPAWMQWDLGVSTFSALARPPLLARMLIVREENRARVLESPALRAKLTALVGSSWPISRRLQGWRNDAKQFATYTTPTRITQPCLVVHGTEDRNVPYGDSLALMEHLEQGTLHTVDGGDHFMPVTHEGELRDVVLGFLLEARRS